VTYLIVYVTLCTTHVYQQVQSVWALLAGSLAHSFVLEGLQGLVLSSLSLSILPYVSLLSLLYLSHSFVLEGLQGLVLSSFPFLFLIFPFPFSPFPFPVSVSPLLFLFHSLVLKVVSSHSKSYPLIQSPFRSYSSKSCPLIFSMSISLLSLFCVCFFLFLSLLFLFYISLLSFLCLSQSCIWRGFKVLFFPRPISLSHRPHTAPEAS